MILALYWSNIKKGKIHFSDFHNAWKATNKYGLPLTSGVPYKMQSSMSPATFIANISYNEIYPQCDLVLYEKRKQDSSPENFIKIDKQPRQNAKVRNNKFSLHIDIEQWVFYWMFVILTTFIFHDFKPKVNNISKCKPKQHIFQSYRVCGRDAVWGEDRMWASPWNIQHYSAMWRWVVSLLLLWIVFHTGGTMCFVLRELRHFSTLQHIFIQTIQMCVLENNFTKW